ncbi:MAG: GTPase domain-containing protein [Candidatus Sulfobium sp.]|jgi:small GTP-binding protein
MALFNYATKEITLKIVYYGPGLSGKTTNLQYLHSALNTSSKGKLLSLSTEADRTLFFDFLPVELGKIRDFSIRFQLYTVPGQVRYNATRRIVLKGADAVVFVADSQSEMREQNIESLDNMRENLLANNIDAEEIPIVFQYNKRDLKDIASVEELNCDLDVRNHPVIEGIAIDGTGVEEAFKLISKLLLQYISKKHKIEVEPAEEKKDVPPSPPPPVFHKADSGPADRASVFPPERGLAAGEISGRERPEEPVRVEQDIGREFAFNREEAGMAGGAGDAAFVSAESIDRIVREIQEIHEILNSMRDSFTGNRDEIKILTEIRKTQMETNNLLRELRNVFAGLRKGRRWFRF